MHFAKLTCDASEYVDWNFRAIKEWNRMADTTIISVQDVSKIFSGQGKKKRKDNSHLNLFDVWSQQPPPFFLPSPKKSKQSSTRNPRNAQYWQLQHFFSEIHRKLSRYVGICGQGPSDHPDLAKWLMEQGIDSVSLNPDSVSRSPRVFCVLFFVSCFFFFSDEKHLVYIRVLWIFQKSCTTDVQTESLQNTAKTCKNIVKSMDI